MCERGGAGAPFSWGGRYKLLHFFLNQRYELEPSTLVHARQELAKMPADADEHGAAQSTVEHMIEQLQARPAEISAEAPRDLGGMPSEQSFEEMWEQLAVLNKRVQAMHRSARSIRHLICDMLACYRWKQRRPVPTEQRSSRINC